MDAFPYFVNNKKDVKSGAREKKRNWATYKIRLSTKTEAFLCRRNSFGIWSKQIALWFEYRFLPFITLWSKNRKTKNINWNKFPDKFSLQYSSADFSLFSFSRLLEHYHWIIPLFSDVVMNYLKTRSSSWLFLEMFLRYRG